MTTVAWRPVNESEHSVQFYETDAFLIHSLSEFIGNGLMAGDACIVLATQSHRASLEDRLRADGLDVAGMRIRDQYFAIDAATTLSKLMVNRSLAPERFSEVIGNIMMHAAQGRGRVRIFGELVALLWADGNRTAAIRLEELWNDLAKSYAFSLFCAYPMHGFGGEVYEIEFAEICRQHSHVIPTESYTILTSPDERLRAITLLQQKANSLEAEIAERKEAEKEIERRTDHFIDMASHELKTPVTSLLGFTQVLQRRFTKRADEESLRLLTIMDTQLGKLTRIVNDLLDISKMQQGKLDYQEELFDLEGLVQEIVANLQATTSTYELFIQESTSVQVYGDRDRIGQVLINLLSNAIKYSPRADTVLIRVSKDSQNAIVSVEDFGIGISPAHHQQIFERFYQLTNSNGETHAGFGIGLYICAEIIHRHHGHIKVESCKNHGSTFSFTLPLTRTPAP
jgi:signal transduction histidine kinase